MTSTESTQSVKRINETTKKSPLKVVSPIIKKYSGHRQGKIKKKLKFSRIIQGGRGKQKKQIKPQLKTILPKTNAGDVIILEPELLPCALNLQSRKKIEEVQESSLISSELLPDAEGKQNENLQLKENASKINKTKFVSNKKKIKCIKNIEASLKLLEFENSAFKEKREQAFAENYLLRIQQRLKGKDENLYNQFLDLICNFQSNGISVCELFKKIKMLFSSHPDLSEDFVAFLTAEQAIECGVFMDHLLLTTMSDFLNMIDIYFVKSPQQIKKIHSVLESLVAKPNVTTEFVINAIMPLLKGNPVLKDYFLQLLPKANPPDAFLTDFEEVEYGEINSDVSDEEDIMETIHLPEVEDHFGGDMCPCKCHLEDDKFRNQVDHCLSCSIKFINGKVFIQSGKLLKPARVVFDDHDLAYHRDRLAPKLYPKRVKKTRRHALFKDSLSPTKSCNLSSDEFKSDIEDEEKGRLKLISSKSPKANRKKSDSPKHCDKFVQRCILNDTKMDISDTEEKPMLNQNITLSFSSEEEIKLSKTPMEVDEPAETENCEFITFLYNKEENKEESNTISRPLDLPKIDMDDTSESLQFKEPEKKFSGETFDEKLKDEASVYDGSHSPPVISIPETASQMLNAKPILSFLENLVGSKDSSMSLDCLEEKVVPVQSGNELLNQDPEGTKVEEIKLEENSFPWKIEEDRVILQTLQVEENCEETFVKIGKSIPARSVEDIKKRFAELMTMLYEMKAKTNNES